jgi:dihydrofolate synthase/folylpolyglutamate synthase
MNDLLLRLLEELQQPDKICMAEDRLPYLSTLLKFDKSIPVVTVTGTNGKGSTVASLKAIYQTAGFRVGIYTSPHLVKLHERIAINNEWIDDEHLYQWLVYFKTQADKLPFQISFFEYLTLVALAYFSAQKVDVIILEVGLGGRLDATNMVDADLVIVTNVDLDHMDYLGDTIEKIAYEKACLFRGGKKAIFADIHPPDAILAMAKTLGTDLHLLNTDYQFSEHDSSWMYTDKEHTLEFVQKPRVQLAAMASAIYATKLLKVVLPVQEKDYYQAVSSVFIPGRLQYLNTPKPILLDVAHNPHAVRKLCQYLSTFTGQIHAVFSILKDKDGHNIVKEFNKLNPIWYNTPTASERSHSKESLASMFREAQISQKFFDSPEKAFNAARFEAKSKDIIVVFGSFTLIEPIMKCLMKEGVDVFSPN